MNADPTWTDVAGVVVLGLQLVVLVAAAIFAGRQVAEAKRLREEQTRPFVIIDFEIEKAMIFLTVSNIGTTLARHVRFEIDPPLRTAIEIPLTEMKMLGEGIPTLAPGKTIRTLFDSTIQRKPEHFPDLYSVTARYSDETGRRDFEEAQALDLGVYRNLSWVQRRDEHDIHERLKDVLAEMKKWTSGTGRGVLRLSPNEVHAENERTMRLLDERRAEREQSANDPETK
jgi:hypothetical protein